MRLLFPPNPIKTSPTTFFNLQFPSRALSLLRSFSVRRLPPESSMAIPPSKSAKPSVDIEVGLARRFWIKFNRESVFAMYSPFCVCLASGNLNIKTFRHYIAQDFHFLKAFAQASVFPFPFLLLLLLIIIILVFFLFFFLVVFVAWAMLPWNLNLR
ncbi:hypothetical protein FEM48_Zijuj02G0174100 [Ziziphus jujuba var. spinosa]|uniref:Thiaminase-2/PQQC domain-containing protein n=1 Tax=Ziziphus jujuba var. spinosa TaxID=714518 RepID=A0A978VWZ7_ZIZJJ|nr:hypothetical protein FEM48_Zijuj02G0174100 [Ziziphus jujuba var. spinosa]